MVDQLVTIINGLIIFCDISIETFNIFLQFVILGVLMMDTLDEGLFLLVEFCLRYEITAISIIVKLINSETERLLSVLIIFRTNLNRLLF